MTDATGSAGLNLQLLLLLDSRSPAGGHGHSAGVEAAVGAGFVSCPDDLETFCRARLATAGRVAAAFAATAHAAWSRHAPADHWAELDGELEARLTAAASRAASRSLGRGLRRLLSASAPELTGSFDAAWQDCPRPAPHHALVLGAGVAAAGGTALDAARAAAFGCVTVPGSASLRLLGLDPYQVHALSARLIGATEEVAAAAVVAAQRCLPAQLPADSAPAMDNLAEFHLQQEVRLFAS